MHSAANSIGGFAISASREFSKIHARFVVFDVPCNCRRFGIPGIYVANEIAATTSGS
jgi:hypothetical protein